MNQAGTTAPLASLRWPVSISWLTRTLTSVTPSLLAARIFIGLPMFCSLNSYRLAAAAAEGDLDFLGRHEELAVRLDQGVDIGGLAHLDARLDVGFGALRQREDGGQRIGVLFDQDGDHADVRQRRRN